MSATLTAETPVLKYYDAAQQPGLAQDAQQHLAAVSCQGITARVADSAGFANPFNSSH